MEIRNWPVRDFTADFICFLCWRRTYGGKLADQWGEFPAYRRRHFGTEAPAFMARLPPSMGIPGYPAHAAAAIRCFARLDDGAHRHDIGDMSAAHRGHAGDGTNINDAAAGAARDQGHASGEIKQRGWAHGRRAVTRPSAAASPLWRIR